MAKKKNNQAKKRQKIESKKKTDKGDFGNEDLNPFELRFNKVKHKVLGRKRQKNEFGKPFINRSRAYQKREQTLLQEYKSKHRATNGLRDMREMNPERRTIAQYKERQDQITLNANDTVQLTHKGRPLDELINDRLSSDEEDLDLFNRDDYIETSHFGGGNDGPPRSKKEILEEILAEKFERKREKEETFQLTERLDDQWQEIRNLVRYKGSEQDEGGGNSKPPEEYDNLLRQLLFEDKTQPREKQTVKKVADPVETGSQTPDGLFKARLNSINGSKDIEFIVKTIKEIIDLLSKVTRKSFLVLKESLVELAETKLKFTPKEIGILVLAAYFKELQILIHLIVMKTLNKIKYSSLKEVACSIFLVNFILETISAEKFCPELFVHLENLIALCMPTEKVKIKLFHRMDYEADCLLNVARWTADLKPDPNYSVTLVNLFGKIFANETEPQTISFNLAVQIFELLVRVHQKYSSSTTIRYMLRPVVGQIKRIVQTDIANSAIKTALNSFMQTFETKTTRSVVICTDRPRPIILPLLEPKLEENQNFMRSKLPERKKLQKKFKREFKGAQREIRKDSTFLRDAYLKEVAKKDDIRKKKVKEILKDLSIQQGLYKKKK